MECGKVCSFFVLTNLKSTFSKSFLFYLPTGWLSSCQPPSAGILSHRSLWEWKHSQGLCLQAPFQVPCVLFQIRKWIHFWKVTHPLCFLLVIHLQRSIHLSNNSGFACRWMEVIRSATVPSSQARLLNSKDPHPRWFSQTRFPHVTYGWHLPIPSCPVPQRHFSFLLYISGTFIHVYMHTLCSSFFNALNGDTSAGLDCIRDCVFILQL